MGVSSGWVGLSEVYPMETESESEVSRGFSSEARLWVRDLVSEVLVIFWGHPQGFPWAWCFVLLVWFEFIGVVQMGVQFGWVGMSGERVFSLW